MPNTDDYIDGDGDGDGAHTTNPNHEPLHRNNSDDGPRKDTKRVLACGTCRKRKLKCDSKRPKCSTCARLGHPCEYDEVRKKSGPKRGYVKSLEARLNQLENLLDQNRDPPASVPVTTTTTTTHNILQTEADAQHETISPVNSFNVGAPDLELGHAPVMTDNDVNLLSDMIMPGGVDFSWDMISLGLEEPLPSPDIMDELYQLYFEKVHPSLPMIHRRRFMASLSLGPNSRPPVCLRYIMWANACAVSSKYSASGEQFYIKARKYVEKDEMQGHGEGFITVAHTQTFNLIACYEFKHMYFPRAWVSVGRATRLAQMLGFHRQDGLGLDVKQTLAPPKDWTDKEERRRTFWVTFCQDRYASIGTGWPMTIDEQDIFTSLPSSEEAFITGNPEPVPMLADVMKGDGVSGISAFTSVILLATLFGRNLTHLHRPSDDDNDHDLGGEFWKRHRNLDSIILNISLSLPGHLRLPQGINDPKIIFSNMNIHTSTICLHQAAIFKADKHKLPAQISSESKRRCLVAADQIANLMRMVSTQDLTALNPFSAFCLYVAARVFVQYLKFKKDDHTVRASLVFLLQAMNVLKIHNPLTESFLVQLDVDLEGSGIDMILPSQLRQVRRVPGEIPVNTDAVHCSPIFDIRSTQNSLNTLPDPIGGPMMPTNTTMNFDELIDQNPYFSMSSFDNGAPDQHSSSYNGVTPSFSQGGSSSRTHSSQPTPSSTTNYTNPPLNIHTNTLPNEPTSSGRRQTGSPMHFKASPFPAAMSKPSPGGIAGIFDMSPTSVDDVTGMSMHINTQSQDNSTMNLDQFGFGSTGLTPGPSGGGTGMTPAFSATPLNEWQNMNVDENNNWTFG